MSVIIGEASLIDLVAIPRSISRWRLPKKGSGQERCHYTQSRRIPILLYNTIKKNLSQRSIVLYLIASGHDTNFGLANNINLNKQMYKKMKKINRMYDCMSIEYCGCNVRGL